MDQQEARRLADKIAEEPRFKIERALLERQALTPEVASAVADLVAAVGALDAFIGNDQLREFQEAEYWRTMRVHWRSLERAWIASQDPGGASTQA